MEPGIVPATPMNGTMRSSRRRLCRNARRWTCHGSWTA